MRGYAVAALAAIALLFPYISYADDHDCLEEAAGVCLKFGPDPSVGGDGPDDYDLTTEDMIDLQIALRDAGFYDGPVDGVFGPGTKAALGEWRAESQQSPTRPAPVEREEIAAAVHGLWCRTEVSGEFARVVFHRDGSVLASARGVALNMDWSLRDGALCLRNHGRKVECFNLSFGQRFSADDLRSDLADQCS
ncbi:MAG: peptidoglycan-binding domain-containing protein [Pseudomonadota bacterium]